MSEYYTKLTDKGIETLLNSINTGVEFSADKIAVGDSNGSYYEPTGNETALKNQKFTGNIFAKGKKQNEKGGYLYYIVQIPPSAGNFFIREAGLFDENDNLLAIAKIPETFKTTADEDTEKTLNIEIRIYLNNELINLVIIDESGNLATEQKLLEYQPISEKGNINGYAPLDETGLVPNIHLPSQSSLPIGTELALYCSSSYVPKGCLPLDGTEYSASQFQGLWDNYLTGDSPKLSTCTYQEYQADIETYGQCAKFGIDTVNQKFKVPLKKDGSITQQALSDTELGKSYNAGLPNITGSLVSLAMDPSGAFQQGERLANFGGAGTWGFTQKYFNASLSSSVYGGSNTVQANAIALRYFVVVANGEIDELTIDWSNWASSLQGKVNVNADNFSAAGKSFLISLATPSSRYINLTFPASGESITAPANGWFVLEKSASAQNQYCIAYSGLYVTQILPNTSNMGCKLSCPCAKGDTVRFYYTLGGETTAFRFVYAKGDE